jgi:hypothetical protein
MKNKVTWSLLTLAVLVVGFLSLTQSASSSSTNQPNEVPSAFAEVNKLTPVLAPVLVTTTFNVDRTDDPVNVIRNS